MDIIFFLGLALFIAHRWISSLEKKLEEKISDLEKDVRYLDRANKNIKKQFQEVTDELANAKKSVAATTDNRAESLRKSSDKTHEEKKKTTPAAFKFDAIETSQKSDESVITDALPEKTVTDFSTFNFSQPAKRAEEKNKTPADEKSEWFETASDKKTAGKKSYLPSAKTRMESEASSENNLKHADDQESTGNDMDAADFAAGADGKNLPPRGPGGPNGPEEPDWRSRWNRFIDGVDWEIFAGANLFAWLGGLALFVGAGFFVKYSIDNDLISPILRLVIGAIVALAMIAGSCLFERGRYDTMRQTFAAGGIGVLYSVFFAATLYYEYIPKPVGFGSLVVVSAAAFVLALFHRGVSISLLGGVGAYLTPLLVTTGNGSLLTLFVYLAIVNVGLFQVMRRLQSPGLIMFAAFGTIFSLGCGTFFGSPPPTSLMTAVTWIANLLFFAVFIDKSTFEPLQSRFCRWAGIATFLSTIGIALAISFSSTGIAAMYMLAAVVMVLFILTIRQKTWFNYVVPFSALTFMVATIWIFTNLNQNCSVWAFLAFFIYGMAGGAGPIYLIHKNGLNPIILKWLRFFPFGISLLLLMAILFTPQMPVFFWPMTIGLQVLGIILSMLFGGLIQLLGMVVIVLLAGLIWITSASPVLMGTGIYGLMLVAGILAILAVIWCLKKGLSWAATLAKEGADDTRSELSPLQIEWMSVTPIIAIFVLLAAAFTIIQPLNPNPGMMVLVCLGAISLTMARRMNYPAMIAATLYSAAIAQGFWPLRPDMTLTLHLDAILWSAGLFITALIVPFLVYPSFAKFKVPWMAWPIFELAQAFFIVYSADHFWGRGIAGWIPIALAFIKLPIVATLLKQLNGLEERNSIIACHGGVLLFYVSTTPILLLENGWIGLVLVLESVALLWLNRRIEHHGLRKLASAMAPVGLYLLFTFLNQMKGPESVIILNAAVMSVLAATLALFAAVKLAPYPDDQLMGTSISKYFLWLAIGTGFFLVNLVVADVFAGSLVKEAAVLKFMPVGNLLQMIIYATLWGLFGAVLWRKSDFPNGIRYFGLLLLGLAALWLFAFPISHGADVALMAPVLNLGLLAYGPLLLIFLFLFMKEPWGESSISLKNLFLVMVLVSGFLAIKVIKSTVLQPGLPLDIFMDKTAAMAVGSAFGWVIYGLAMLVWPKRLDRPFRLAGFVLMTLGFGKALLFPFRYSADFGAMQPLLNKPTLLFAFCIGILIWLTKRRYDDTWPFPGFAPSKIFATMLAVIVFCFLNIEIASVFGAAGKSFSLLARGNLAHQLGYSLGWLIYAIVLLVAGIKWNAVKARQAALILVLITSFKIFFKDLWALGQLYRVASFVGLAVILMLVSYLYQRFLTNSGDKANENV